MSMTIKPGVGIGDVQFGIKEVQLLRAFGKPDQVDEEEYRIGAGDWYRVLWYFSKNVSFTFEKDDDYRLGTITVIGRGYSLFGKELFGLSKSTVKRFLLESTHEISKVENWTWTEDGTRECLDHNGLGILFWFDSDRLSGMQCGYLFESDSETIIWPK